MMLGTGEKSTEMGDKRSALELRNVLAESPSAKIADFPIPILNVWRRIWKSLALATIDLASARDLCRGEARRLTRRLEVRERIALRKADPAPGRPLLGIQSLVTPSCGSIPCL